MAFGVFRIIAAAILLAQITCGQQYACSSGYGSQNISPISLGSLNYGSGISSGCGSNLGYNGASIVNSGLNYGSSNLAGISSQGVDVLTIAVGSSIAPSGISVSAPNLEIGGQLNVNGQLPVLGAVALSGGLPTGGQAQVQYSSDSGVGLTSGGCGYGLASSVPNVGYGNSGQVGYSGLGLGGGNCGLSGLGVISSQSRGCGF